MTISKFDAGNNNPLTGATVTMTKCNYVGTKLPGAEPITVLNGTASASLNGVLETGVYYLVQETYAPAGYAYVQSGNPFVVSVDAEGKFKCNDLPEDVSISNDGLILSLTDNKIKLTINKISKGEPIRAEFSITGIFADSNDTVTKVIAGNTSLEDGMLVAGNTYKVVESKVPDGYDKIGDFSITVNKDGTIESSEENPLPTGVSIGTTAYNIITVSDDPIQVVINKFDSKW